MLTVVGDSDEQMAVVSVNVQRKPRQKQIKGRRKCLENRSPGKLNVLCISISFLFFFFAPRNSLFKEYLQFAKLNVSFLLSY